MLACVFPRLAPLPAVIDQSGYFDFDLTVMIAVKAIGNGSKDRQNSYADFY